MITNTGITIYNKYYNRDTMLEEWHRTQISVANWQGETAISVGDKGLNSDNTANIYIPMDANFGGKTYVGPKAYANLSHDELSKHFTFSPDDKIVKGLIDFEVTGLKPNNIAGLESRFDDVLNVISVHVWDQGSISMRHYKVVAK